MPVEPFFVHVSNACSAVCVLFQARHGESPLLLGEKFGISWCVWHEEETDDPKDCRYDALNWVRAKFVISMVRTSE